MSRQSVYRSPYSLVTVMCILFIYAGNYARFDEDGVEIPWGLRRATYLSPFHTWLQGTSETDWPSVFPYAGSEEWDENAANANFLEGCLFAMNAEAFPSAMARVVAGVESYPEETR